MTEALYDETFYELFLLEKRFRLDIRRELSKCDVETILFEARRVHEQVCGSLSALSMIESITHDEAIRILWLKHKDSMGS